MIHPRLASFPFKVHISFGSITGDERSNKSSDEAPEPGAGLEPYTVVSLGSSLAQRRGLLAPRLTGEERKEKSLKVCSETIP